MCHCCEGQTPVSISCLSLEELIYLNEKKEEVHDDKRINENLKNNGGGEQKEK